MFHYALEGLGIPESEWGRVVMVGNNLARDIVGAPRCGLTSVWFRWNQRYPGVAETEWHVPDYRVSSTEQLFVTLLALPWEQPRSGVEHSRAAPLIMFDRE